VLQFPEPSRYWVVTPESLRRRPWERVEALRVVTSVVGPRVSRAIRSEPPLLCVVAWALGLKEDGTLVSELYATAKFAIAVHPVPPPAHTCEVSPALAGT
jgi:hypothetical protein